MIPFAKPFLNNREAEAAAEVLASGWLAQGPRVREFEAAFSAFTGSRYACAASSCTAALHMALLAVGAGPGDVVITASHSFIATPNSLRYCGAEPVFVDIDADTYNISAASLERCLREDCENRGGRLYYKDVSGLISVESRFRGAFPRAGRTGEERAAWRR